MSYIENYLARTQTFGSTTRERSKTKEIRYLRNKMVDSLSSHKVTISHNDKAEERLLNIINSDNIEQKFIMSMPEEDFTTGSYVEWSGSHWIIIARDANTELYTRVKIIQCNHVLKRINRDGTIHEAWAFVEDGTKYLTGEYADRKYAVTRGDSRVALTVGKNKDTLTLNREHRFIIDDDDNHEQKLAYSLTKPLKAGLTYIVNGQEEGIFKFILQEVPTTEDDNLELGIADYYKYAKKEYPPIDKGENDDGSEKRMWL